MKIKFRRRHLAIPLAAIVIVTQFALSNQPDATADIFPDENTASYAELWAPHSGFTGGVTDGACTATSPGGGSWYLEPSPGCTKAVTVTLPADFGVATKAELFVDLWAGRENHVARYSINGGPAVTINAGYDDSRTPVVIPITVGSLQSGSNTITFSSSNGKYHVHDVAIRLYGVSGSFPSTGGLTTIAGGAPGTGAVLDVTGTETVAITATVPGATRVEFIAYYDGYDEDNDGDTTDWHAITRQNFNPGGAVTGKNPNGANYTVPATGGTIAHVGTVLNNGVDDTYSINWDTSLVASQTGVKFKVRAISAAGGTRLNVTDAVGGVSGSFEIKRSNYLVEYYRDTDFTDALLHADGAAPDSTTRTITLPTDRSDWQTATHVGLYWQNPFVKWNAGTAQTAFINNEDVWNLSKLNVPLTDFVSGNNTIEYSYNSNTTTGNTRTGTTFGQHIEEPGAMLVVKRAGDIRILTEPQSQSAINGQQVTLSVVANGLGPISYQWTKDNAAIGGATSSSYTFTADDTFPNSEYRVEVSNPGGTTTSQPAMVTIVAAAFQTDDFSNPTASAGLWTQVDGQGGATFVYTGAQAVLSVPQDTISHQPWTQGNKAPTLRQSMANTDFDLATAFESRPDERFEIQGVIVAGPGEFLRFDVNHNGTDAFAFAAHISSGVATKYIDSIPIPADHTAHVRVKRVNDTFTMYTSADGSTWVQRGTFSRALAVTEFGPFGGNAVGNGGIAPQFHAIVDYVDNVADPMGPEADNDSTAATISNVAVVAGPTSLIVSWTTNEPTTGSVDYVLGGLPESRSSSVLGYSHSVTIVGLATETTYPLTINADDINGNSRQTASSGTTTAPGSGPTLFDVWYGNTQDFGSPGSPQRWVNVLGRVSDPQGVDKLEYRLNGGAWINMGLGADGRRLHGTGDFNVDLLVTDLLATNTVELRATDSLAAVTNHTVTVNWNGALDFPLPYVVNWANVSDITDAIVPVDGYWTLSPNGLTINNVDDGYDRLAAIGEQTWSQYDVLVPVTVNSYAPDADASPSNGPGIGVMLRWNGHNDELLPGSQPQVGFKPLNDGFPTPFGSIVWFRDPVNGDAGLQILDESAVVVASDTSFALTLGTTYMFRARVTGTSPATYSLRVWPQGQPEPTAWTLQWTAPGNSDEPLTGSIQLLAHEVDAVFGNVVVIPQGATAATVPAIAPSAPLASGRVVLDTGANVTLTAGVGATIHYTTDGTTPSATSAKYTAPFTLTGTAPITVKAIAYKANQSPSPVASKDFIVNAAPVAEAGTGLTLDVGQSGTLGGSFTDDGVVGPVTTTWSKLAGPGTATFSNAASLTSTVSFDAAGSYTLQLAASDGRLTGTDTVTVAVNGQSKTGYWMVENDGTLYPFGDAEVYGPIALGGSGALSIVTTDGSGVWVLDSAGKVHVRGSAGHFGDLATSPLALAAGEVPATLSVRPNGTGYWIFTNRGRAIPYGSAVFYGDVTHLTLVGDVISSVSTTTGLGYYMVGSDGGIFTFGDAVFHGSVPQVVPIEQLAKPLVGIAPDPDGAGYWLVAGDGGIFSFAAPFVGSVPGVLPPGVQLAQPVVGAIAYADGYLAVASDGGIFNFSSIDFLGSLGANPPDTPVKGVAAFVS